MSIEAPDEIEQMLSEAEIEIADLSHKMKICKEKYKDHMSRKQEWEVYVQKLRSVQLSKPLKRRRED